MELVIETNNLSKKYSNKYATNKINMHVRRGDIYGFIGKNGAGKTTLMKQLLGLVSSNEGTIKLFGSDDLGRGRKKIGSLIEEPGLYKNCTAYENMKRFSIIYGGTDEDIWEILKIVGLDYTGKKKAGKFSLGMRQRLGIAIALLGNPEVLILDEPINGLDPAGIKDIRDTIIKLNKERNITFLIASHLLDELAKITTNYGIINDGVLVEELTASELEERCRSNIKVKVSDTNLAIEALKELSITDYKIEDSIINIYSNEIGPDVINEVLVKNNVRVYELSYSENAFENYFIERIDN